MLSGLPRVSFCLMCCNNAETIGLALSAGLRQTYQNLEIVISDDCSDDASVSIIQSTIADYEAGGGTSGMTKFLISLPLMRKLRQMRKLCGERDGVLTK